MTFSALENEISPSIIFPYGSLCHVPPQGFGYVLVRMFFLPYITCLLGLLNVFLRYYPLQKRLKKCYYPKSKRYMLSNVHSLKRSFFLILWKTHYFYSTGFTLSFCPSYTIPPRRKSSYTISSRETSASFFYKQSNYIWRSHVLHHQTFSHVMLKFGLKWSKADYSEFYCHTSPRKCVYLVVCVDDIVITRNDVAKFSEQKEIKLVLSLSNQWSWLFKNYVERNENLYIIELRKYTFPPRLLITKIYL